MGSFESERIEMVERQLKAKGIYDPKVLAAMSKIPRELFIPEMSRSHAYSDSPVSIGEGQTISQPYIVALMTQSAKLKPADKVLEIGTGSGFQAAILANLVKEVYSVERIAALNFSAQKVFSLLGLNNIHTHVGDGSLGWPQNAPYDVILVTACAPEIPQSLVQQLKPDGRLIIPIGDMQSQELVRFTKGDKTSQETIEYVRFVPLIGQEGWDCKGWDGKGWDGKG